MLKENSDNERLKVVVTSHAIQRMKERNGWGKATAMRMAQKIYEEGTNHHQASGYIAHWLTERENRYPEADFILHGAKAYVFSNSTLITVLNIPNRSKWAENHYSRQAA